ncbi:3-hydroxyacyl-ACP dehydratase FabZ family protein [Poritiphilus flavus]|uniref:Hydroxymyristoyl-ACP dehydratase n=1 Tax=Poritiphilus flavus TaxID=2697053 RepID=A0A6L9EF36_9FLAO|nr:FabA/FabZ family ACP-dehydratase [Poritiphilus flavus]NAS13182.1 hydroxymyristoyl-ACP dehydratase [Poritiphilus flavus]
MDFEQIISILPYDPPFHFVDELLHLDTEGAEGTYTFSEDLDFYRGHFRNQPVTPGVILTECCAQIGLVCLGIFLQQKENPGSIEGRGVAMSSSHMEFYKPVFPGEKVVVRSKKQYFRFGKLKCEVRMYNAKNELVSKGELSGMIKVEKDE